MGATKKMYEGIKKAIGPVQKKISPPKDAQGNSIHDESKQIERWVEHYGKLYGEESEIGINKIEQLSSFDVIPELNILPTFDEMIEDVKQMPYDKSPGNDAIPAEVFKYLDQGWANYGPPSNCLRPANNFSELARVFVGISVLGFAFSLQRLCVDDDHIRENVTFTS